MTEEIKHVEFSPDGWTVCLRKFVATTVLFKDNQDNILLRVPYVENEPIPLNDFIRDEKVEYVGTQDGVVHFVVLPK